MLLLLDWLARLDRLVLLDTPELFPGAGGLMPILGPPELLLLDEGDLLLPGVGIGPSLPEFGIEPLLLGGDIPLGLADDDPPPRLELEPPPRLELEPPRLELEPPRLELGLPLLPLDDPNPCPVPMPEGWREPIPLAPALLALVPLVPILLVLVPLVPTLVPLVPTLVPLVPTLVPLVPMALVLVLLAPVPPAIWLLWDLLFQFFVTPRLPSVAPPPKDGCLVPCRLGVQPVRRMPTLNRPINPVKGFLPIGMTSPV